MLNRESHSEAIQKMILGVFKEKTDYFYKDFQITEESLTKHLTSSLNEIYTAKYLSEDSVCDIDEIHELRSLWANGDDSKFLCDVINANIDQFKYILKAFENYTQHANNFYPTSYIKAFMLFSLYDLKKPSEKQKIKMICDSVILNNSDNPCDKNWDIIHDKNAKLTKTQKNAKDCMLYLFGELIDVYAENMANGFIAMTLFKDEKSIVENFVSSDLHKKPSLRISGYKIAKNISLRDYKNIKLSEIDSEILIKKYSIKLLIDLSYHHDSDSRFKCDLSEIIKQYASESELKNYVINSLYCMNPKLTRMVKRIYPEILANLNQTDFETCRGNDHCLRKGVKNLTKNTEKKEMDYSELTKKIEEKFFTDKSKEERKMLKKVTGVAGKKKISNVRI